MTDMTHFTIYDRDGAVIQEGDAEIKLSHSLEVDVKTRSVSFADGKPWTSGDVVKFTESGRVEICVTGTVRGGAFQKIMMWIARVERIEQQRRYITRAQIGRWLN